MTPARLNSPQNLPPATLHRVAVGFRDLDNTVSFITFEKERNKTGHYNRILASVQPSMH